MNPVRAAVVQAAPAAFDLDATLDRVRVWTTKAAAGQPRIILFPEAFVGGYPRGIGFGAVVGERTREGREWFRRYWAGAIDVPGPAVTALGEIARQAAAYLVIGVIEREGGTLYCSVLFFSPAGAYLGKHRKLMPTASERLIWGFGDGSTLTAVETPHGTIGAVICWENYMPLLRTAMYAKGVSIYCAPTADSRDTWLPTMRHVALEGRCFVLSANQFARRRDYPDDYPLAAQPDDVLSRGGSCIVSPLGEVLAGPAFEGECVLEATLDLDDVPRAKFDFDPVGHYARPDVFRLTVDEERKQANHRGDHPERS